MTDQQNRRLLDGAAITPTLIGHGAVFTGTLECRGDLVVSGAVHGNGAVAGSLTLADNGSWQGDVAAQVAIVAGELRGNIVVTDKLEIRSTARIQGSVRAKSIAIATGGIVDGDMAVTSNTPVIRFDEKRAQKTG